MIKSFKKDYSENMVKELNKYLSNVQVTYMNVRGYHWNVSGEHFFTLHEKYEEIYNNLNEMADEIAERILTLGGKPLHSFSDYLKFASVQEKVDKTTGTETVNSLLSDFDTLLSNERAIVSLASNNDDEGTTGMVSEFIGEQEKIGWMLNAFLKK